MGCHLVGDLERCRSPHCGRRSVSLDLPPGPLLDPRETPGEEDIAGGPEAQ